MITENRIGEVPARMLLSSMTKDDIMNYIVDTILWKEVQGKRPLVVTLLDITAHFKKDVKPLLRELAKDKEIHHGRTLSGIWFSIYRKDKLL